MKKTEAIILFVIVAVAFALRVYDLAGHEMATDDSLYSFRSIGYIDYVAAINRQSTPVTWFSEPQWWQKLSFHDHPPLVFIIQWLFFKLGGVNMWTARLPFALAGTVAVAALFALGKTLFGPAIGILAAAALAISNYAVWISRIGFLDGFLVLWIILSIYCFAKAEKKAVFYVWWGIVLALGILTKYTFLFMMPLFFLWFMRYRRRAWRTRWPPLGLAAFLVLISPVVVYNAMMWRTRGHLDAALSTMIGAQPADFRGLTREINTNFNLFSAAKGMVADNFSLGFTILLALGFGLFVYKTCKLGEKRGYHLVVLMGLFSALLVLTLVGAEGRFGVIILPFAALFIGAAAAWLYQRTTGARRVAVVVCCGFLALWELIFSIQGQLLSEPLINKKPFIATNRPSRGGYNELERYVNDFYKMNAGRPTINTYSEAPQLAKLQNAVIERLSKERAQLPPHKQALVYDDRLAWFQTVWTFERLVLYEAAPIQALSRFLETIAADGVRFYTNFGLENAIFIIPTERMQQGRFVRMKDAATAFVAKLEQNYKPVDEVRAPDGNVAFNVYRIPLAQPAGK